jgi:hypothetical protein
VEVQPRASRPWYLHRALVLAVVLVVALVIVVVVDLSTRGSRDSQTSDDATVMSQVNSDVGPCSYALGQAYTIYHEVLSHDVSPSYYARVPGLLTQDRAACTLTDNHIHDLSTIETPGGTAGSDLGDVVRTVTLWASSDAVSAIGEMETLTSDPSSRQALSRLDHDEQMLSADRAKAETALRSADKALGAHLPALELAQAPAS